MISSLHSTNFPKPRAASLSRMCSALILVLALVSSACPTGAAVPTKCEAGSVAAAGAAVTVAG